MINVIFYAIQFDSLVSQLLVAGIPTPLNMSSSMGRMTSHIWWKMFNMFETTNHIIYRSFSQEIVTYGDLQLRASGSEPLYLGNDEKQHLDQVSFGAFLSHGGSQNGWFIRENPRKLVILGYPHDFGNRLISLQDTSLKSAGNEDQVGTNRRHWHGPACCASIHNG